MLGGGIEFGEPMRAALAREFKEEIGAEITIGRQLGAQESLFIFEGKQGHEIVFMFEAEFIDKSFYDMDEIPMIESVFSGQYATWADIGEAAFYGVLGN
jgi:ADP-ribose pyrophosphatase YjhB (NUDIX family)